MGRYLELIRHRDSGSTSAKEAADELESNSNPVQSTLKDGSTNSESGIEPSRDESAESDQRKCDKLAVLQQWYRSGTLKGIPSLTLDLAPGERSVEDVHGTVNSWLLEAEFGEHISNAARHRLTCLYLTIAPMIESDQ